MGNIFVSAIRWTISFFIESFFFFLSDFDNHIFVTTDAEAFFFLHDLISSYVKEKQRVLNIQQQQNIR